jgi:SAM-dependent methyltransferase
MDATPGTEGEDYARRLTSLSGVWWKRLLNVQAPYRWNLARHRLGRTLDIGCGIGRNLATLPAGSLGVDHNEASVAQARAAGFEATTADDFFGSRTELGSFDSLLLSHVVEHMPRETARELLGAYLPFLRPGGTVFFICPQERGYASDPTHVCWTTDRDLEQLSRDVGLLPERSGSFPFPRRVGRFFTYNEFNVVARKPA